MPTKSFIQDHQKKTEIESDSTRWRNWQEDSIVNEVLFFLPYRLFVTG